MVGIHSTSSGEQVVHLVGTPRLELEEIMVDGGIAPSESEAKTWASGLQSVGKAYASSTLDAVSDLTGLPVNQITGQDIMTAVEEAFANKSIDISRVPVINLAPLTLDIADQVSFVREQVVDIINDGGTVHWNAPSYQLSLSRAVLHNLNPNLEDNRGGFVGDRHELYLQFRHLIENLKQSGHDKVIVVDDRCSESAETMKYVRDRLNREGGIGVLAFVVGHSAPAKLDRYGHPTCVDGVRVVAPFYRYDRDADKGSATPSIADEFKDLGFGASAGHCYMEGYNEQVTAKLMTVSQLLSSTVQINGTKIEIESLVQSLHSMNIVADTTLLEQVLRKKSLQATNVFSPKELRDLFSKHPGILKFSDRSFNPDLASPIRIPMMWPGEPTQNSFHRLLERGREKGDASGWLELSYRQLHATINVVESLEALVGHRIPSTAFPFLATDKVRNLLPQRLNIPGTPTLDILSDLTSQVELLLTRAPLKIRTAS